MVFKKVPPADKDLRIAWLGHGHGRATPDKLREPHVNFAYVEKCALLIPRPRTFPLGAFKRQNPGLLRFEIMGAAQDPSHETERIGPSASTEAESP